MPRPDIASDTVRIPLGGGAWTTVDRAVWESRPELRRPWRLHRPRPGRRYAVGGDTSLHRLLMGNPPGRDVDHIDGDGLNNRLENLRVVTRQQNAANRRPNHRHRSSPYKGVMFERQTGRWRAQIGHHYRRIKLGRFRTPEEAARAYDRAALALNGEFAYLNHLPPVEQK